MRTLTQHLSHSFTYLKEYDSFEDYCIKENKEPTPRAEDEYFVNSYFNYSDYPEYVEVIYETLGESLSVDYVCSKLEELFPQIKDYERKLLGRDDNTVVKFKAPKGFNKNPRFHSLLNRCNWYVECVKKELKDIGTNLVTFTIEPRVPNNYTEYIYSQCKGILYRIMYTNKANKALRYGLSPVKTADVGDADNRRIYFVSNTSTDGVREDLRGVLEEVPAFRMDIRKNGVGCVRILKIDLNKMRKQFNNVIQIYIDPRMKTKCYWTAEFIAASCISDVTEEFTDVLRSFSE